MITDQCYRWFMTLAPEIDGRLEVRSSIVHAATELLQRGGAQAVTTRAVADAAGVPAPTIFRLFGDKGGLMEAVAEQVMATYAAAKAAKGSGDGDPVGDLHDAWRAHITFGLENPDLFVLLVSPGRLQRSPATAAGIQVLEARIARLAAAGLLRVPESRAVGLIHAAGSGVVLALVGQPEEHRDPGLAEAAFEAVLGGILARTPAPPVADLAALTVTFRAAVPQLPALSHAERALLTEWLSTALDELRA